MEEIRRELRDLIKYIPPQERAVYTVDLTDEVVSSQWRGAELESDDLADYRERVNYYIRQHRNEEVIRKLHANFRGVLFRSRPAVLHNSPWGGSSIVG